MFHIQVHPNFRFRFFPCFSIPLLFWWFFSTPRTALRTNEPIAWGNAADRLSVLAGDLVRLGEVRHKDQHCVGTLGSAAACWFATWEPRRTENHAEIVGISSLLTKQNMVRYWGYTDISPAKMEISRFCFDWTNWLNYVFHIIMGSNAVFHQQTNQSLPKHFLGTCWRFGFHQVSYGDLTSNVLEVFPGFPGG